MNREPWTKRMWYFRVRLTLGWLLISACGEAGYGDGGRLCVSRSDGNYRLSVFSTPTPFRAGLVDISVLVQDNITGVILPETSVTVRLRLQNQPGEPIYIMATEGAATNKLLKAAVFDLPSPGRWEVEIMIKGELGSGRVYCELVAGQREMSWPAVWPWFSWPIPVILLFSIHEWLVSRTRHQRALMHQVRA